MRRRPYTEVALQLLEDIDEAWRWPDSARDGEAEAMGLTLALQAAAVAWMALAPRVLGAMERTPA